MRVFLGWSGVALCTLISSFWAFWGAIEGFHEGWHHRSAAANLWTLLLYLLPGLTIAALGWLSVRSPRVGAGLFALAGVLIAAWMLSGNFRMNSRNWFVPFCFALVPVLLGLLFYAGNPHPRRAAAWVATGLPVLVMLVSGAPEAWRVARRQATADLGPQTIEANGIPLVWAGEGPGWGREGSVSWDKARSRCARLSADGKKLMDTPQNVWRLPTVEEVVASMSLHGRNCGGRWDAKPARATFRVPPDKEPPLWDTNSPVTYYWTDTEAGPDCAYWVVYDGGVFAKSKSHNPGNAGFRAVKEIKNP